MRNYKIKLAAIARDEAAYLPEWIFHHLYFGFDEIEIYVNNTSDNTANLLKKVRLMPVKIVDADRLFKTSRGDFQFRAYQQAASKAKADGFSHIMFLDIDEFWTPRDFTTSIHAAIDQFQNPQVLSFHWLLHCDEDKYSNCYKPSILVKQSDHLKTIFKTDAPWTSIGCHNIIGDGLDYRAADGSKLSFDDDDVHRATAKPSDAKIASFFVMHRMFRSEMEYISLLGRGRPSSLKVKNNRPGYYSKFSNLTQIEIDKKVLESYYSSYNDFILKYSLSAEISKAQDFVRNRFNYVLDLARKADGEDALTFHKVFDSINIHEVKELRAQLEQKMLVEKLVRDQSQDYSFKLFVLFLKARLWRKLNRTEKAYQCFAQAANLLSNRKRIVNADLVQIVLEKNEYPPGKMANIHRDIARELSRSGHYEDAFSFIDKALELRPQGSLIQKLHASIRNKMNKQIRLK
ncbi:glycosyltransferase family 2 protein [Vibrio sp. JC009]|uniref:glycosyltransferase family 2 protein n=1 Tax=Vibrio sp. JC009 TaxID=2912314 RepID=UPI0023AF1F21|nr:glycosyltransferase family 2 protein [Vibrio sp. JC009]WED24161.1 glycosyltransferase family 2 protein [Vibrio sp. JC009]